MEATQVIKVNNSVYVINMDSLIVKHFTIDEFRKISRNDSLLQELISTINGPSYLQRLKPVNDYYSSEKAIVLPSLLLSYECNYTCTYCYQKRQKENSQRITADQITGVKEFYSEYSRITGHEVEFKAVHVSGGEPFLPENKETIEKIAEVFYNKTLIFATNGTFINDYRDILSHHCHVKLWVSIDGAKEVHYLKRVPSLNSHYDDMMSGVKWAVSEGIDISIMCVFDPDYADSYSLFFDEIENLGWLRNKGINLVFLPLTSGAGCDTIESEYLDNAIAAFIKLRTTDGRAGCVDARQLMPGAIPLMKAIKRANDGLFDPYRCECLVKPSYSFTPGGLVYLCSAFEDELGCIGRYWPEVEIDLSRINLYSMRRIENMEACNNCVKKVFCNCGCAATAVDRTHDIHGIHCSIWANPTFLQHLEHFTFNDFA